MTIERLKAVSPAKFHIWLAAMALSLPLLFAGNPAWALSEIQREELPPATGAQQAPDTATSNPTTPGSTEAPTAQQPATGAPSGEPNDGDNHGGQPAKTVAPSTAPAAPTPPADVGQPATGPATDEAKPGDAETDKNTQARPDIDPNAPLPEVLYDETKLPEPVARTRKLILEAAKTGDPEKLRALMSTGPDATQLSLTDNNEDPIKFLVSQSGDEAGQEILAILEEVLEAGYVHLDAGQPEELYVWPYFYAYPLARLTPAQKVEIYRIVTASDFDEMSAFGNYIFFRVGIAPDGRWAFFVAGE